ncbi:hypothetical protein H1P_2940005 [Hyella patelloides LEGE 07179]|uniref:Uncharacterized protein n=1 Tax=Hyella patelloides LEGE 07179 TaxID=945734 RepID=A0A563VU10_9CYAN|nr:hypothetical protein H1P_2940005 [Hyella patelloides LEGE 07179]
MILKPYSGEVAEWSIALDLKSSVPCGTVGSNPTLSVFIFNSIASKALRSHQRRPWNP